MAYEFPKKIFPSRVTPFLRCPFQFKCKNDPEIEVEWEETPASFTGKVIHDVLEKFFDIKEVPIDQRKDVDLKNMVREAWRDVEKNGERRPMTREEREGIFGSREQERAYGLKTISILNNFLAGTDLEAVPVALEEWMDCRADDFLLAGRIDRVDQETDDRVAVLDYKSGKLPFHKSIKAMMKENLQIPIYSVIAAKRYPAAKEVRAGLIYVKHSRVFDITWTRDELKEMEKELVKKLSDIKSQKEYPPMLNKLCPLCDYKDMCSAYEGDK